MPTTTKDDHYFQAQLLERGWTPALIRKLLGPPDATARNPHRRSGPPMKLFAVARVETAEATDGFRDGKAAAAKRSAVGKATAARKAAALIDNISTRPLTPPPVLSRDELIRQACESFNAWQAECGRFYGEPARPDSKPHFLYRICSNFIRHELTDYDAILAECRGRVGTGRAYHVLRGRIKAAVKEAYPWLAELIATPQPATVGAG